MKQFGDIDKVINREIAKEKIYEKLKEKKRKLLTLRDVSTNNHTKVRSPCHSDDDVSKPKKHQSELVDDGGGDTASHNSTGFTHDHQATSIDPEDLMRDGDLITNASVNRVTVSANKLKCLEKARRLKFREKIKAQKRGSFDDEELETQEVWLKHKDGILSATVVSGGGEDGGGVEGGKLLVKLQKGHLELIVDASCVEKANPPEYNRVENLGLLRQVNQSSLLNTLQHRFNSNLVHTFAGMVLISIPPPVPLRIYSTQVVTYFQKCRIKDDLIPHIYSIAQSALISLYSRKSTETLADKRRKKQAIITMGGVEGENSQILKNSLEYLVTSREPFTSLAQDGAFTPLSNDQSHLTPEKVLSALYIFESFTNFSSAYNSNTSGCTKVVELKLDDGGEVVRSVSFEMLNLESCLLTRRFFNHGTFHVFRLMLEGMGEAERERCHLPKDVMKQPNILVMKTYQHKDSVIDDVTDDGDVIGDESTKNWLRLMKAMDEVGFGEAEVSTIITTLSTIHHLGRAGCVLENGSGSHSFGRIPAASRAASLLEISCQQLSEAVFQNGSHGTKADLNGEMEVEDGAEMDRGLSGVEKLWVFVEVLYGSLCTYVLSLLNRYFRDDTRVFDKSILLVDPCGFRTNATSYLGFQHLCSNFLQDRLNLLFHREEVTRKIRKFGKDFDPKLLLSHKLTNHTNLTQSVKSIEKKFSNNFQPTSPTKPSSTKVAHLFNSTCVDYCHRDLLLHSTPYYPTNNQNGCDAKVDDHNDHCTFKQNVYDKVFFSLKKVLEVSENLDLRSLSTTMCSCVWGGAFKENMDTLINEVEGRKCRWIYRLNPNHIDSTRKHMNQAYVREQLETSCLLESTQVYSLCFDHQLSYQEFCDHFKGMLAGDFSKEDKDHKQLTKKLLEQYEVNSDNFKIGETKVFLKEGAMDQLLKSRDEKLKNNQDEMGKMLTKSPQKIFDSFDTLAQSDTESRSQDESRDKRSLNRHHVSSNYALGHHTTHHQTSPNHTSNYYTFDHHTTLHHTSPNHTTHHHTALHHTSPNHTTHPQTNESSNSIEADSRPISHNDGAENGDSNSYTNYGKSSEDFEDDKIKQKTLSKGSTQPIKITRTDGGLKDDRGVDGYKREMKRLQMKCVEELEESERNSLKTRKRLMEASDEIEDNKDTLQMLRSEIGSKEKLITGLKNIIDEQTEEFEELCTKCESLERAVVKESEVVRVEKCRVESLEEDLRSMREQNKMDKRIIENAVEEAEREAKEKKDLQEKLEDFIIIKNELQESKDLNESLKKAQTKQGEKVRQAEETIQGLIKKLSDLEGTNLEAKKTAAKSGKEVGDVEKQKRHFYLQIQAANRKMEEMENEKESLLKELEKKNREIELVKLNADKYKDDLKKRKNKMKSMMLLKKEASPQGPNNQTILNLKSLLAELQEENEGLRERRRLVGEEMKLMQEQMECWDKERKQYKDKIDRLTNEMRGLSNKLEEKEDEVNDLMHKYSKLVEKNSSDLARLQEQSQNIQHLTSKLSEALTTIATLEEKSSILIKTASNTKSSHEVEGQIVGLKMALEEENILRKRSETQLKKSKDALKKKKQEMENLKAELKNELEIKLKTDGNLKVQKSRCLALETRIQDLENIIKQMKRQGESQKDECRGHTEEVLALKRRLSSLQTNIMRMDFEDVSDEDDFIACAFKRNSLVLSSRRSLLESSEA